MVELSGTILRVQENDRRSVHRVFQLISSKSCAIAEIRKPEFLSAKTRTAVLRNQFHASNSLVHFRKQNPAEMTCTTKDPDQKDVQMSVTVPDDRSNLYFRDQQKINQTFQIFIRQFPLRSGYFDHQ